MLSKFSVRKPYTVVVSVVLILILGIVSFSKITVDLLPSMNLPYAIVMTTYTGASPEEVETTVTRPVEQAMATISNIKTISSSSQENASTVMLEFEQTANMDSATIEMRETLDQISGYWPDTVGNPLIMKLNPDMMPIMVPAISAEGEDAAETSRIIKEEVLPEIESLEGVASVTSFGSIEETVRVIIKQDKVSNVDRSVQDQLEKQFSEATAALDTAKSQMEEGKAQLEAGKNEAAGQISSAESQISQKQAELTQGQMEVESKLSEIAVGEAQLSQTMAALTASKTALEEQNHNLENAYQNQEQIRNDYAAVLAAIAVQGETQELLVAKAALEGQLALIDNYEQIKAPILEGLAQIEANVQILHEKQAELNNAKTMLNQVKEQLASGAVTLAQARGQMSAAQIEAALQMGDATAQLAVGEAAVQSKEEELKAAKETAKASADVNSILNASTIQTLLTAQNFNMPAGYVDEDGIDYLIRVGDKLGSLEELKNLVLVDMEGINPIRLSDIADVEHVNNEEDVYAKLNGENGIVLQIQKQTGYSTGDVSNRIQQKFEELKKSNEHLDIVVLMDQGVYIDMIVNSVLQNLLFGAILAILILLLFLRDIRPTFVIACSIPISILTAIVLMYFSGVTMNIISLSGLALGVGMLVDNSIVVIENIYRMRNEEGASAKEAAIAGAKEVAGAISASTFTTICVFLPIVFTEGIARQLFVDMGLTIAYSLLASLLVALTLVPMMSAGLLRKTKTKESRFFERVKHGYARLLRTALLFKPVVLATALLLLIVSGGLAFSRGTAFMPEMQSTEISMTLEMPEDAQLMDTAQAADAFTEKLRKLKDIGDVGGIVMGGGFMGEGASTANEVQFYALISEDRTMDDDKLQAAIEKIAQEMGLKLQVSMSNMDMSALGASGISIQIKGRDLDKLQQIAGELADIVKDVDGAVNVSDGMEETTTEMRVMVDKEKAIAHNLTVAQVYQELAAKLKDAASTTSLAMDAADLSIFVSEQKNNEMSREDVKSISLSVTKQDGTTESVSLKDIALFEEGQGLQSINRNAQSRCMNVTAEVAEDDNIGLVSNRVKKAIAAYDIPDGYEVEMTGEDETIQETMIELLKMLGLAIVFMYLIMVAQFQSMRSPFIIMFTVPLAFTGGLLGLYITGSPVSVIAMIGFVMLSGIIVNNGIVFVDYANQLIAAGKVQKEALVETGITRLRPIVMTALTTILGLSTMAIGVGMGADMVQPMAVVTIGGLIYGTLLTLFVVPCIFDLFHKKEKARLKESIESTDDEFKAEVEDD